MRLNKSRAEIANEKLVLYQDEHIFGGDDNPNQATLTTIEDEIEKKNKNHLHSTAYESEARLYS